MVGLGLDGVFFFILFCVSFEEVVKSWDGDGGEKGEVEKDGRKIEKKKGERNGGNE